MRWMKWIGLCMLPVLAAGQDPHFTQYNGSPFTVNPAYTGVFNGKARFTSQFRQQWGQSIDPFITTAASLDVKVGESERTRQHPFNVGVQFMNDRSLKGAFRSNYAALTASYHVPLDDQDRMTLGAGLMGTYGSRRIDFSSLSFDEQFASGGFIRSLPTGEPALQQMKPFVSVGAGLLFCFNDAEAGTFFELGVSGYHFNKPKQTVYNDPNQFLPRRYSIQASLQKFIGEKGVMQVRTLYQNQAAVEYIAAGLTLGTLFGEDNRNMVGVGAWYRSSDAISPVVFMEYNRMVLGISYDMIVSNLKQAPQALRSFEFSLQWKLGQ